MTVIPQFDRKQEEEEGYDHWSDHESDVDESALVPDNLKHALPQENDVSRSLPSRSNLDVCIASSGTDPRTHSGEQNEEVEYIDELGRTRRGTRREAREAEEAKGGFRSGQRERDGEEREEETGTMGIGQAHAEVL